MKKDKKIFTVYGIEICGIQVYIGRTNNLHRRQLQHNNICYNENNKQYNKDLYKYIRKIYPTKTKFKLTPIKEFNKLVEAKRYEMYLILTNYFSDNPKLIQKVPSISDYL